MKTTAICPISTSKIDENVARFNATLTVLLLAIYFSTGSLLPIFFLAIDFLLRGLELSVFSPLAKVSKYLLRLFNAQPKPINAGPKIFAARIGLIFSIVVILFSLLGAPTTALVFAVVFGICAFLEAAVGFCVACQIYPFVYKLVNHSKD